MNQRQFERHSLWQQGVTTLLASLVFLLVAVLLWRMRTTLTFAGAIIFFAWGLHGVLRGGMFLREAHRLGDED